MDINLAAVSHDFHVSKGSHNYTELTNIENSNLLLPIGHLNLINEL